MDARGKLAQVFDAPAFPGLHLVRTLPSRTAPGWLGMFRGMVPDGQEGNAKIHQIFLKNAGMALSDALLHHIRPIFEGSPVI